MEVRDITAWASVVEGVLKKENRRRKMSRIGR
jgi:hypothetical protein